MERFGEHFGWIEIVFTAVVALGFAGWQYWSVSREIRRDKEEKEREEAHKKLVEERKRQKALDAERAAAEQRITELSAQLAAAVEAGRLARGAGRIPRATTARASSPVTGRAFL